VQKQAQTGYLAATVQKGAAGRGALGSNTRNVENWKKVGPGLRGHALDVTGLDWSPDGSLVASCSVDNTVVVWDVSTGNKVGAS
jgi:protein HIRA/HIR1